jgi:hypothetical protein
VEINGGKPQWLRVDTGCASPLQWVAGQAAAESAPRQIAVGLAEVAIPQAQTSVRLGQLEFKDVPTGLQSRRFLAGETGLLGTGLLERFSVITIDTRARRLVLRTASSRY